MATPNATFTELVTTTFRKHGRQFADNVSNHNALYKLLGEKGQVTTADGGLSIVEPLEYDTNSTYQRYSGYDTLNVASSEVFSAAEFNWKQIAIHVTASGLELRTNSGASRLIPLAKSRIKNAIRTFANNFSSDMYSNGSATNQIDGLQKLVSDDGTGTVGGIVAGTYTWWKNQFTDMSARSITLSSTTMEATMLTTWMEVARGNDEPDLIIMDPVYYALFDASQTGLKRYSSATGSQSANAGLPTLMYRGAKVVYDTSASGIPASHAYFLNTNYLKVRVHPDANLTVLDEAKPYNQDAVVIPVLWMGNTTISNRRQQGVMLP